MCGLFSPNFFSFSFFFLFEKRPKKKKESKEERSPAVFFLCVWNFALSSVVSSDFCLKIKKKKAHTNPTMRRRGCARTRHHNDRPRSPSLRPSLCGHFFVPQKKIYIYPLGKHTMMHHATCQSITARTAALLATKRQLKNRRNASSVIVRAQEFIATDKAPAAAGPYSQGIKVRLGRF